MRYKALESLLYIRYIIAVLSSGSLTDWPDTEALSVAMAPSEQAVTTCLMDFALTSPAANTPGTVVLM